MWRGLWYDDKEKSIRGSFINMMITAIYIGLIITGSFLATVASNLKEMETLLIGFFVASLGIWSGKKVVEFTKKFGLENVLGKHGLNLDDLPEAGETLKAKRMNGTVEQRAKEREAAK